MVGCIGACASLIPTQSPISQRRTVLRSTMRFAAVSLCFACAISLAAEESIKSVDPNDGWKLHGKSNNVAIYARIRAGTALKEFRAVGEIDPSSRAVHSVIDDIENYSRFMPY